MHVRTSPILSSHSRKLWPGGRRIFLSLAACSLLPLSSGICADETESSAAPQKVASQSETAKQSPPPLPPPRPLKLPSTVSYKLPNGLMVELLEDHRVPFVTFNLGIKAGASFEPKDMSGLSSITAGMLCEGTSHKTSRQIAEEVDFIGGTLKAGADADFTLISGSALSRYTPRLFNILCDVVLNPTFPEDELKLQKTNLLQELVMKRSSPDFLMEERFHKVVFGNHPYAVVAPTPESVEHISAPDLVSFHKTHYLPNESVLIVVGDFKVDTMKELVDKTFGAWKPGQLPATHIAAPPAQAGRKIYLVDRPGSVQASIKIGNIGIKKSDPDLFPVAVANQVLGGAAFSRLFLNIREQKGYTYGAYSGFDARKMPGDFAAEAEVRTPVVAPSLQEFLYELDRIRNVKISDKELETAKKYLAGSFQLGLETQGGLAQRLLEQKIYDLPADYLESYTGKVMAVTPDDVRRVLRNHIDLDNIVITVVGDGKQIRGDLEYFAPVETYDTSGKLVGSTTKSKTPGS